MGANVELTWVNGQPGAVTHDAEGRVINVFALDIAYGKVQAVRSVINPDKLHHLGPVSDVALRGPGGQGYGGVAPPRDQGVPGGRPPG